MTGTGSAVFGIFSDKEQAKRAQELLAQRYNDVFIAEPQESLEI